jgi:hypothetical protein
MSRSGEHCDRSQFLRFTGLKERELLNALQNIRSLVRLDFEFISIRRLAVQFGNTNIQSDVERLFEMAKNTEAFRQSHLRQATEDMLKVVCFDLTCQARGVRYLLSTIYFMVFIMIFKI